MRPVSPVIPSVDFPEVVYAKDQPQYIPLPVVKEADGRVTTRWKLTWKERLKVFLAGNVYLQVCTFNHPLQPLRMTAEPPAIENEVVWKQYDHVKRQMDS